MVVIVARHQPCTPSCGSPAMADDRIARYQKAFQFAQQQVTALIERDPDYFPIYTTKGKWHHGGELWTDWTGGFLAGMMWQFYRAHRRPSVAHAGRTLFTPAGTLASTTAMSMIWASFS